jgi:hypothetical protein
LARDIVYRGRFTTPLFLARILEWRAGIVKGQRKTKGKVAGEFQSPVRSSAFRRLGPTDLLKEELRTGFKEELRTGFKEELRTGFKEELRTGFKEELRTGFKEELRTGFRARRLTLKFPWGA